MVGDDLIENGGCEKVQMRSYGTKMLLHVITETDGVLDFFPRCARKTYGRDLTNKALSNREHVFTW